MATTIQDYINNLASKNMLLKHQFIIISIKYLCSQPFVATIPRELAIISFSLENGIGREFHCFTKIQNIPTGQASSAKNTALEYHGIPVCNFDQDRDDFCEIWQTILGIVNLTSTKESPTVFCKKDFIEKNRQCVDWILEQAGEKIKNPFIWGDVSTLIMQLCCWNIMEKQLPSISYVDKLIHQPTFEYCEGIACQFHKEIDNPHCSLAEVHRCCFSILGLVLKYMKIEPTHNHLPSYIMDPDKLYDIEYGFAPLSFRKSSSIISVEQSPLTFQKIKTPTPKVGIGDYYKAAESQILADECALKSLLLHIKSESTPILPAKKFHESKIRPSSKTPSSIKESSKIDNDTTLIENTNDKPYWHTPSILKLKAEQVINERSPSVEHHYSNGSISKMHLPIKCESPSILPTKKFHKFKVRPSSKTQSLIKESSKIDNDATLIKTPSMSNYSNLHISKKLLKKDSTTILPTKKCHKYKLVSLHKYSSLIVDPKIEDNVQSSSIPYCYGDFQDIEDKNYDPVQISPHQSAPLLGMKQFGQNAIKIPKPMLIESEKKPSLFVKTFNELKSVRTSETFPSSEIKDYENSRISNWNSPIPFYLKSRQVMNEVRFANEKNYERENGTMLEQPNSRTHNNGVDPMPFHPLQPTYKLKNYSRKTSSIYQKVAEDDTLANDINEYRDEHIYDSSSQMLPYQSSTITIIKERTVGQCSFDNKFNRNIKSIRKVTELRRMPHTLPKKLQK